VQIGGKEQLFNLIAGRKLQEAFGQRPQVCLTYPILVGTDGHMRMSKSTGNYIGINEPPEQMYGKVMSIPDEAMHDYFNLVTRWTPDEIAAIEEMLAKGELHPRDAKMKLAREIAGIFHGDEVAAEAEAHFRRVFQEGELPSEMPSHKLEEPQGIVDLLVETGMAGSKGEARRLVKQGGVRLDGERVTSVQRTVTPGEERILQVGKRRFVRLCK